ncbi:Hsp70 family protein [Stigmatella aurantiaca]|uniref:Chaperone protein DnaK n=1 Tax=Stigmatella aurantiaca (strain DW4/3-1) TaxID=378806 RepID=Q08Z63_STIAD|nr:Hsp70 family protein [Stigmatella aurantiaca]ADO72292.1 Chaperone protein DnaK [Stigmatella aurantiaca DW4/3-1]EAU65758.1 DnaK protein [Stigmatella aurantiaca DW4/3-1]
MQKKEPIIGIDLGTTNSCAAYVDESGNVKLIPYKGGDYTIPSIFAIDDKGNELIGFEAKRQWQLNPRNTIYGAKRLVGRGYKSDIVDTMKKVVAYSMRPGKKNDVVLDVGKKEFTLQEVSAKILNKIRDVAANHLKVPVRRAVVTVPAYFNDRQRQSVKDAGKLIDLEVVRIINEPTAAALAYGVGKGLKEKVVVYDLGGGTFDVSIIEIRDRVFEVKSTGGDIFLGGIDFDNAIIHHVLKDFASKTGIDLATDPVAMQRIKDLAERTKIDLSAREEVPFNIPFITMTSQGQPLNIEMKFTRRMLEQLTNQHIDRSLQIVARVLVDSGLSTKDIDQVMLVGGQTRMPIVQDRLTKFFGKPPSKGVHPDEAVAIGAALYANSLEDNSNLRIQLLDVIPMAIGLEKAGGAFHTVFPRNAAIPNAKQLLATTSMDNQTELAMRIFQGDHEMVAQNDMLGEFTFSGIRADKAGRVQVEITFDVSVEGILTMRARDPATGREMRTTVRVSQS